MKEIKAYVHRSRIADVIAALKDSPPCRVGQRGKGAVHPRCLILRHVAKYCFWRWRSQPRGA